jgi:hypothetical protein
MLEAKEKKIFMTQGNPSEYEKEADPLKGDVSMFPRFFSVFCCGLL